MKTQMNWDLKANMNCSKDGCTKTVVNKYFKLCQEHNNERLHGNKYGKRYEYTFGGRNSDKTLKNKKFKSISAPIVKESVKNTLHKDEELYEKVFNNSNHRCEECGGKLNDVFRDENGKIINRWRYSHVIAKSIAPQLRHKVENINNLCLQDHQKWDFGSKEEKKAMKIYEGNKKRFPQYF